MPQRAEVVITGLGIVSPIGIGRTAYWQSLLAGRSGVSALADYDYPGVPVTFGAEVRDFEPKEFIRPRKSLKVMSREIQLSVAAAELACRDARLAETGGVTPERFGVIFAADLMHCDLNEVAPAFRSCLGTGEFDFDQWGESALSELYPLWMLKYLPNMPACHIAIAQDARGPNNTITLGDVSSLVALTEAVRVIERGAADVIITGGGSSRLHPTNWVRSFVGEFSHRIDDPQAASRPFDSQRDGMVNGEGATTIVLERRERAEARGATILAEVLGYANCYEPRRPNQPLTGKAISRALGNALENSGVRPHDIGHVNAHGLSTEVDDRLEARAIEQVLGQVPVTAPKSYFGNLGSGSGAVELAASLLSFESGIVPPTLNYEHPDRECPVKVVSEPLLGRSPIAVALNQAATGQAIAVCLRRSE